MTISQCIEANVSAAGTIDCRHIALATGHALLAVKVVARAMGYEEIALDSPIFAYREVLTVTLNLNTGECFTNNINPMCDVGW